MKGFIRSSQKALFSVKKPNNKIIGKKNKFEDFSNFGDPDSCTYVKDGQGPIEVYTRIIFSRMGNINTIDEKFDCHAFIECYWDDDRLYEIVLKEANLVGNSGVQLRNKLNAYLNTFRFNPWKYWTPRIHYENAIGEVKEEKIYKVEVIYKKFETDSHLETNMMTLRVFEQKFARGIFYERLELYDFPMDTQELTITICSHLSENDVKFVENVNDESSISTDMFLNEQEWNLFNYVVVREKSIRDTFKGYNRSGLSVSAYVARKSGYFFNNAYSIIFLITILGFVPFSVDPSSASGRMSVAGVLILTQVNFRWVITARIPPVPYLTSIDKYAIGNLFIQVLFAMWHSIIGSQLFDSISSQRSTYDSYALYTFAFIFTIYTFLNVIKIVYTRSLINKWKKDKNSLSS